MNTMKKKLFQVHNSHQNGLYSKLKDAVRAATGALTEYSAAAVRISGKRKKTVGGAFTARNGATITVIFAEVIDAAKIEGQLIQLQ